MPDDPTAVEIASAIVSLGRNLKLEVLAEGVETRAQFDELVRIGCDSVQGWFFSRAVPPADLPLLLGRGRGNRHTFRRTRDQRRRSAS